MTIAVSIEVELVEEASTINLDLVAAVLDKVIEVHVDVF